MYYSTTSSPEAIVDIISQHETGDADYWLILVAEGDAPDLQDLVDTLNHHNIQFLGGVFPGVIHNRQHHLSGVALGKISLTYPPQIIQDIGGPDFDLTDLQTAWEPFLTTGTQPTALVLVDGLMESIGLLLSELYDHFGRLVSYLGGGAGSLSLKQAPCLFVADGVYENAALIALFDRPVKLGVQHGWQPIAGPFIATNTSRNTIVELDWQPAMDVYKRVVDANSGKEISAENFFDIAKGFPFGMHKDDVENIVRDPILVNEEGALVCVGEVPQNSALYILKGETDTLVKMAGQAAADAIGGAGTAVTQVFLFDCISRVLFMEEDYHKELDTIYEKLASQDEVLVGALSLGEISSYGKGFLEFFNKTVVIGVINDK